MTETPLSSLLLTFFFFPTLFQKDLIAFCWGAFDPLYWALSKRLFLLLPACAVLIAFWASLPGLLSVIIRQKRRDFLLRWLTLWWNLGYAVLTFWGGILRFLLVLFGALIVLVRVLLGAFWFLLSDLLLVPFRLVRTVAAGIAQPGFPWIAVMLTAFWCFIEATIFTYVMTPLVLDTLSNLTGEALSEITVRLPLFLFLLFLVLGSYAVVAHWTQAFRARQFGPLVRLTIVEIVAVLVEVLFLYREFVDALIPWFSQYGSTFEPGAAGLLSIATLVWLGIRGMTWFLFAAHGTPVLLALIQGAGVRAETAGLKPKSQDLLGATFHYWFHLKSDAEWIRKKCEDVLSAFLLPPLQVLAASLNFAAWLISSENLFSLPFENLKDASEKTPVPGSRRNHRAKISRSSPPAQPPPEEEHA